MNKIVQILTSSIFLAFLWMVFMEQLSVESAFIGFLIGFSAILITEYLLLHKEHKSATSISIITLIQYCAMVFINIYTSGYKLIRIILSRKAQVVILEYETSLKDEFLICLFANSITLTPGTIVIDKDNKKLKILCIHCPKSGNSDEIVNTRIELILKMNERRKQAL